MTKTVKYGIWTIAVVGILSLLSFGIFLANFDILGKPEKEFIDQECDYEGLRRASLYTLSGNASANPSIHISIDGCNSNSSSSVDRVIFTADKSNLDEDNVKIKWISFDTLIVEYTDDLRIFNQERKVGYPDTSLNLYIEYIKRK
jgi:hypothetical protein